VKPPLAECTGALILGLAAGLTARRWWPLLERAEGRVSLAVERGAGAVQMWRFNRASDRRYARLMGDHLSREQLRALHREACKDAPVTRRRFDPLVRDQIKIKGD
jgi:hypothetical protein